MPNPLRTLWGTMPPKTRRYFLIVFFILALVGVIRLISHLMIRDLENRWEEHSEKKASQIVGGVVAAFGDLQRQIEEVGLRVVQSPSLKTALLGGAATQQDVFFIVDSIQVGEEHSLEVYDSDLTLLAWLGKRATAESSEYRRALASGPLSVVSRSTLYTYLTVALPVRDDNGKLLGLVAVSRPVEVNYPLNNRYLSSSGIQSEFSKRFETNITFEFNQSTHPGVDSRTISTELRGLDGTTIGRAIIEAPTRVASIQDVQRLPNIVIAVLLALLPFPLFFGLNLLFKRVPAIPKAGVVLALVWGTRYLWLEVDFPSSFLQGGIFDPSHFASPFGYGLTSSIGELLITSLFVIGSAMYSLTIFIRSSPGISSATPRKSSVLTLLGPIIGGALFLFLIRGYAAAIRSAVFDSKLRYIDPTTIVPDAFLAAMLFCILLLTVSLLVVAVVIFLSSLGAARESLKGVNLPPYSPWVFLILLFIGESLLFGLLHPTPQTSETYRIVLICIIAICAFVFQRETQRRGRLFTGTALGIAMASSIIIATPVLDRKIHDHDRESLRQYAQELTRPSDVWARLVLEESLNQMVADPEVREYLVQGDEDLLGGVAFRLWARSGLSRQGFGGSVGIIQGGRIQSLFNLGLPRSEVVSLIRGLGGFSERKTLIVGSGGQVRGLDRYVGVVPVFARDGSRLANIVVVVVAGQGMLLRSETPEILKTPSAQTLETQFRILAISEYVDRKLVRATAEDFTKGRLVPEEVLTRLSAMSPPFVWVQETIGSKDYESVYTSWRDEGGRERILALSLESLDIRWHIFNLLKVVFFYLVIGFVVAAGYIFYVILSQRRFHFSFRGKLVGALLTLATVPLVVLSYYDREFTEESRLEILRHQVEDELKVVHSNLTNHLRFLTEPELKSLVTDSLCEKLAQETGIDFSVFLGNSLKASSKPELYDAELIDSRLNSSAYRSILLEGQQAFLQSESIGKFPYLVGYQRLEDGAGRTLGALSVITAFKHLAVDQELFKRSAFIFSVYAVILLLFGVIGVFFAYKIGSPIKKLRDAMRHVSNGDLDYAISVHSKDELGDLVDAFNKMTQDLKRIQRELTAAERELAWREMAKQVAHEIKNPLTPMRLSVQHLQQAYKDRVKDFQQLLEEVSKTIIDQVDALSRIATEFSRYARMPERKFESCDIHQLLKDAVRLYQQNENVSYILDLDQANPTIVADQEELRRVFINILRNAVQAIVGDGEIRITTKLLDGDLKIEIADTGRGIPEEVKHRLFEPNFSTKSEGMGLGLAISKQTILDLKGQIDVESKVGEGTCIRIILPVTISR